MSSSSMLHASGSPTSASVESMHLLDDSVSSWPRIPTRTTRGANGLEGSVAVPESAVGTGRGEQQQADLLQHPSMSASGTSGSSTSRTTAGGTSSSAQQQTRHTATSSHQAMQLHPRQRQQRGQQQQLQERPLLNWRLAFRQPELERSYWQQRCEQKLLLLDRMVVALNLLVLLNVASSRLDSFDLARHTVSVVLLCAQGLNLMQDSITYVQFRPLLMCAQRIWRALLRFQYAQSTSAVAKLLPGATGAAASMCKAPTAAAISTEQPPTTGAAAVQPQNGWAVVLETALIGSGVLPSWAYAWAYQAPFGTAPILQNMCLLLALVADSGRLLQQLSAPQLQTCIAQCFNAVSAISNWLLLPLTPLAAMPTALACPAMPALPLLLWLQLFWALAAPAYVLYQYEQGSKVWFWLELLAGQQHVSSGQAQEAQTLLRQVLPRRIFLRHAVTLLLLAAVSWQACELLYWFLPDSLLQQLLRMQ